MKEILKWVVTMIVTRKNPRNSFKKSETQLGERFLEIKVIQEKLINELKVINPKDYDQFDHQKLRYVTDIDTILGTLEHLIIGLHLITQEPRELKPIFTS